MRIGFFLMIMAFVCCVPVMVRAGTISVEGAEEEANVSDSPEVASEVAVVSADAGGVARSTSQVIAADMPLPEDTILDEEGNAAIDDADVSVIQSRAGVASAVSASEAMRVTPRGKRSKAKVKRTARKTEKQMLMEHIAWVTSLRSQIAASSKQ
jgi:hypothetical protein